MGSSLPGRHLHRTRRKKEEKEGRRDPLTGGAMCQWLSEGIWGLPLGAIAVVEAQIWANKNGGGHPNQK